METSRLYGVGADMGLVIVTQIRLEYTALGSQWLDHMPVPVP